MEEGLVQLFVGEAEHGEEERGKGESTEKKADGSLVPNVGDSRKSLRGAQAEGGLLFGPFQVP